GHDRYDERRRLHVRRDVHRGRKRLLPLFVHDYHEPPRLSVVGASGNPSGVEDSPLDVLGNRAVRVAAPVALARDGEVGVHARLEGLVVRGGAVDADSGSDSRDDRLLRALVETLAATLDRAEELVQVDLERREDAVRPVLHLEARLARLAPSLVDDLL